jgi:DNA-binding SARP family transcriptional activator
LAALFSPDADQAHARAMLRYTLASVRQSLSEGIYGPHLRVERDALGIYESAAIELDLTAVQSAAEHVRNRSVAEIRGASELCHGDFLDGFRCPTRQSSMRGRPASVSRQTAAWS